MNQYEVTFIVDPVLSDAEIKATSNNYVDHLKNEGCAIIHVDEMGLKQLAYSIKRRNSGFYYCIEFQTDSAAIISKLELALRRDERIMRFLTVKLDKFGVKYNDDKRNGLIKKKERKKEAPAKEKGRPERGAVKAPASKPKSEVPPSKPKPEAPIEKPKSEVVATPPTEPKSAVVAPAADEVNTTDVAVAEEE